jgi:shikimate dehydrogenase
VAALAAMGCRGLNVTIPHKQAVARLCAELTPLAQRLGAVNTLVPRPDGSWLGCNTDVEGFLAPLQGEGAWHLATAPGRGAGLWWQCPRRGGSAGGAGLSGPSTWPRARPEALQAFSSRLRTAWAPQLHPLPWGELDADSRAKRPIWW